MVEVLGAFAHRHAPPRRARVFVTGTLARVHDPPPSIDYDELDRVLTITTDSALLRIRIERTDLGSLAGITSAWWRERRSIAAGTALGNPVYWCRDEEARDTAVVLVGRDDETWELALRVPLDLVIGLAN